MIENKAAIKDKIKRTGSMYPKLANLLQRCEFCHHACKVDRTSKQRGKCGCGREMVVYTHGPHRGEEPPLSGKDGSGTIFFSPCNLECVYCQNHKFSAKQNGKIVSARELAGMMLDLQEKKCHNINLVTPTPHIASIIEALFYAYSDGLKIPVIYNTAGYDSPEVINLLDGIIDIYLPDMRYSSNEMAEKYSKTPGYVEVNRELVKLMKEQVGDLFLSDDNIATRGLIIRILLLPQDISGTERTFDFIRTYLGVGTFLSVMSQYYPAYKAASDEKLKGRIGKAYYDRILDKMKHLELHNGWIQPLEGGFDPSFAGENF
ncbi:MAG: radical SAM protein [Candidatus Aadella gelida]|nr:radical SAM protein [Candidatus Aadella gelida]